MHTIDDLHEERWNEEDEEKKEENEEHEEEVEAVSPYSRYWVLFRPTFLSVRDSCVCVCLKLTKLY